MSDNGGWNDHGHGGDDGHGHGNNAPTIVSSSSNVVGTALTEDVNVTTCNTLVGTGSFAFTDVDRTDSHSISQVVLTANDNPLHIALGTLTASVTTDSSGGCSNGKVSWNYTVSDAAVQFLAAGQVVHETFQITLSDNHGGTVTQNITVTITGTNDVPTIVASPSNVTTGAVTQHGSTAATTETAVGTIAFADVDLSDTHSISKIALTANDSPLHSALGTLTAAVSTDSTNGTGGKVTWTYNVSDASAAFLAAGQVVHETYQITVADNHGGTVVQNITVTITGTNDAPTIVASPTSVTSAAVAAHASGTETGSGTFAFADLDLTDAHSISQVALTANDNPCHTALGTLTAAISMDTSGSGTGGKVSWSYSVSDSAIQFLAAAQIVHETYQITIADNHGGTTTQNVTVTITGTNAAPVIVASSASVVSAAVTEHASGAEAGSGTFAFADVNLTDTHTVSAVTLTANDSPLLNALGTLTASVATDTTGSGSGGKVAWSYSVNDSALQFLAAGQVVHETYQVTVADNHGGTTVQNVTVTITGTDEAPVIVAAASSVVSAAVAEHVSGTEVGSGTFAFADVDLTDSHSISQIALTANDNSSHAALGTLTAAVTTDTTASGAGGKVSWTYSVGDASLQFLAAGQIVHETYQVTVADNHGGTTTQNITVTITGTNDAPVIVASSSSVTSTMVTEHASGTETGSGSFAFADVDLTDAHSISQIALIANDNPGGAALGALTASVATDTTGSGAGGKVAWTYSVSDASIQFLAAGQVVHETYQVTVADGHGGTATQNITVTITGTAGGANHAPTIVASSSSVTSAAVTAHASGTETGSGTFAFADVDISDTHSVSQIALTANDNPGGAALGALTASVSTGHDG